MTVVTPQVVGVNATLINFMWPPLQLATHDIVYTWNIITVFLLKDPKGVYQAYHFCEKAFLFSTSKEKVVYIYTCDF